MASLGQQILGRLNPPEFSIPHNQDPLINLGKVAGTGLLKFDNNCKKGEQRLYKVHEAGAPV
jgi:hypothetical protein